MELKSIDVSNDEIYSQQEREQILEKVKSFYENKLAEKDKFIKGLESELKSATHEMDMRDILINQLKSYRLKKSDVEVKVGCHSCECGVTDDIQDCYCKCTCNFGEDSDYDCIYEEDINAENDCPRNKEGSWQYEISEKQYESLEE